MSRGVTSLSFLPRLASVSASVPASVSACIAPIRSSSRATREKERLVDDRTAGEAGCTARRRSIHRFARRGSIVFGIAKSSRNAFPCRFRSSIRFGAGARRYPRRSPGGRPKTREGRVDAIRADRRGDRVPFPGRTRRTRGNTPRECEELAAAARRNLWPTSAYA